MALEGFLDTALGTRFIKRSVSGTNKANVSWNQGSTIHALAFLYIQLYIINFLFFKSILLLLNVGRG